MNQEGRASSMPTSVTTTRRRGKKTYLRVHDAEECEQECTATTPCVAFTFIPMIHRCDLKAEEDAMRLEDVGGAISGKLEGERPAMARMVGNQSVTWSHSLLSRPAGTRPGLWMMAGVRVPPSYSESCQLVWRLAKLS